MPYQEEKLRAIGRLSIFAVALSVLLLLSVIYPDQTESLVQRLPLSRHGREYAVWLAFLWVMVPLCWAVNLGLIFTSPEQEVRFSKWSKRWRKTPTPFDTIEFDTLDPAYRTPAWRYFLERRRL